MYCCSIWHVGKCFRVTVGRRVARWGSGKGGKCAGVVRRRWRVGPSCLRAKRLAEESPGIGGAELWQDRVPIRPKVVQLGGNRVHLRRFLALLRSPRRGAGREIAEKFRPIRARGPAPRARFATFFVARRGGAADSPPRRIHHIPGDVSGFRRKYSVFTLPERERDAGRSRRMLNNGDRRMKELTSRDVGKASGQPGGLHHGRAP
jgi:hypothetical protein